MSESSNNKEINVVIPPPHPTYYLPGGDLHIIVSAFQLIVFHSDSSITRQRTLSSVSTAIFSPGIRLRSKEDSTLYLPVRPRKVQLRIHPLFWKGLQRRSSKLFFGFFITRTFIKLIYAQRKRLITLFIHLENIPYMMQMSKLGRRSLIYRTNSSSKRWRSSRFVNYIWRKNYLSWRRWRYIKIIKSTKGIWCHFSLSWWKEIRC